MEILYKVYALLDNNNCVIGIDSTAFYIEEELIKRGYVYIDEGSNGETYGHAQPFYLQNKYGKPTYDEQFKPNFKYVDKIVELTKEEKETLFPPIQPQPSELEKLKMEQEVTAQAVQDLILMMMGGN